MELLGVPRSGGAVPFSERAELVDKGGGTQPVLGVEY